MLVLSRKKNERVVVGTPAGVVELVVLEVRGDKVRLGIEAPRWLPVHRHEVVDAMRKEGADPFAGLNDRAEALEAAVGAYDRLCWGLIEAYGRSDVLDRLNAIRASVVL